MTGLQFTLLGNHLLQHQGNCYDVAKELFGQSPKHDEGDMLFNLAKHAGVGLCMVCETWMPLKDLHSHPIYTRAGPWWCCDCKRVAYQPERK